MSNNVMKVHDLMAGCKMLETSVGNILFGCPSEVAKVIMEKRLNLPSTIVLPENFFHQGVVQVSSELMRYIIFKILKGYRTGKRLNIIGTKEQVGRMHDILRIGIFGPTKGQYKQWGIPQRIRKLYTCLNQSFTPQLKLAGSQDVKETELVSQPTDIVGKNEEKNICQGIFEKMLQRADIHHLAEFIEFSSDVAMIDGLEIKRLGKNLFSVKSANKEMQVNINFVCKQKPPLPINTQQNRIPRSVLGATALSKCVSGSNLAGYRNGLILWINGLALAVDGVAWAKEHLDSIGINQSEILAYILTHTHDDQAHLLEMIDRKEKFTLITARTIYKSFTYIASKILGQSQENIEKQIKFREVKLNKEMDWYGARINFWHTAHTIPTIGFRVSLLGKCIVYSGDTAWGSKLLQLAEAKLIDKALYRQLQAVPGMESELTFFDAGGGGIHARPHELAELAPQVRRHLVLMQLTELPDDLVGKFQLPDTGKHWEIIPQIPISVSEITGIDHAPYLSELDKAWRTVLLSQSKPRIFSRGEIIISRGRPGDYFYIILDGTLSLKIGSREIARLRHGDFLSDTLISMTSFLGAQSLALTPVTTLEIPKEVFAELVSVARIGKDFHYSYDDRPALISLAVLDRMPLKTLNRLFDQLETIEYRRGDVIVERGVDSNTYYGIMNGEAEIHIGSLHKSRLIAKLFPKYVVRSEAFKHNSKHSARIIATRDTKVFFIVKEQIQQLMSELPGAYFEFGVVSK